MTNAQLWTIVAAYLGGIVALVVSIWSQGHGIHKRIDDLNGRIGKVEDRLGALDAKVDMHLKIVLDKIEELEKRK